MLRYLCWKTTQTLLKKKYMFTNSIKIPKELYICIIQSWLYVWPIKCYLIWIKKKIHFMLIIFSQFNFQKKRSLTQLTGTFWYGSLKALPATLIELSFTVSWSLIMFLKTLAILFVHIYGTFFWNILVECSSNVFFIFMLLLYECSETILLFNFLKHEKTNKQINCLS